MSFKYCGPSWVPYLKDQPPPFGPVMLYISCSNTCNSLKGLMLQLNLGQIQRTLKKKFQIALKET